MEWGGIWPDPRCGNMGVRYNGKVKKIPVNTHSSCSDLGETAIGRNSSHPNITIKKYMRLRLIFQLKWFTNNRVIPRVTFLVACSFH